jgi:hypothetical protein
MPFVEQNHPVETLTSYRPDEAFTMRIRLRGTYWRLQDVERHRTTSLIHGWREGAIETDLGDSRQEHECNTRRIVRPSRSNLAFDVTRQLLAEEEVLGDQLPTGPEHEPQQAQQVSEEGEHRSEHVG